MTPICRFLQFFVIYVIYLSTIAISGGEKLRTFGAGGTVLVHVSLTTVTWVRFRQHAVMWLKLPWSRVSRALSSLTLPSIAGFLRVLRFPLVVILDRGGVALAGPLGRAAQVADKVIQYKYTLPSGAFLSFDGFFKLFESSRHILFF